MDVIGGMGQRYLENVRNTMFDMSGTSQKDNNGPTVYINKSVQNSYMIDKSLQKRIQDVEKIQGLIDDLKNTKLMKDKESLNPYVVEALNNSANLSFSVADKEKIKKGDMTINVQKLASATVIATDNMDTSNALNIEGHLEVNGMNIAIAASDSISTIRQKVKNGYDDMEKTDSAVEDTEDEETEETKKTDKSKETEAVKTKETDKSKESETTKTKETDKSKEIETAKTKEKDKSKETETVKTKETDSTRTEDKKTDTSGDTDAVKSTKTDTAETNSENTDTADANSVSAFSREGVLYLKTNAVGEDTNISLEGSTENILNTLGLVNESGDIKNLVQQGSNGRVSINGDIMELKGNDLTVDGVKLNFEKAIENETTQIKVSYKEDKVIDALNEFKDKYNKLVDYINKNINDDATNATLKNIKYKLSAIADPGVGIKANEGTFYEKLIEMKSGIGNMVNESLRASGLLSNKDGQIEFDMDKIKENIDKVRDLFDTENESSNLSVFKKNLDPYTAKVNILSITKSASQEVLDKSDKTGMKKSVIESALKDNTDMFKFLADQSATLGLGNLTKEFTTLSQLPKVDNNAGLGLSLGLGFGGQSSKFGMGNINPVF